MRRSEQALTDRALDPHYDDRTKGICRLSKRPHRFAKLLGGPTHDCLEWEPVDSSETPPESTESGSNEREVA